MDEFQNTDRFELVGMAPDDLQTRTTLIRIDPLSWEVKADLVKRGVVQTKKAPANQSWMMHPPILLQMMSLGADADPPPSGADVAHLYPDFPLDLIGFFSGKHVIQFLGPFRQQDARFSESRSTFNFDAEKVYFKPQVTKFKNREVTANPKPQNLSLPPNFQP